MIDQHDREREEIEALLPWYENGTLTPDEMRRVESYLAAHPELQSQLALIREELTETIAANESLGMPSSGARDRLMARIAAEAGAPAGRALSGRAWWSRLLPEGWSPALGIAGAAACLVILVQAVALISLSTGSSQQGDYHVAAGKPDAASPGTFVLVRFAEGASAQDVTALLQSVKATIVDGPKPGGAYRLRISSHVLPTEERDAVIDQLRTKTDIVAFVAPAG